MVWAPETAAQSHPGGLAGDRIGAFGVGQVVMEGQPEARAGTGGPAGQGDLGLVEVPLLGLAAAELEGAGAVEHRSLHRRHESVGGGILDGAVFHGRYRDAGVEGRLEHAADDRTVAAAPASAMDVNEQRGGLVGLRTPEIDHLHAVRAVGDVLVGLDGQFILQSLRIAVVNEGGRCLGLLSLGRGIGGEGGQRREQQGGEECEGVFHGCFFSFGFGWSQSAGGWPLTSGW